MTYPALEKAIVRLLKERPFYGRFLLNLHRVHLDGANPLGITVRNGEPTLLINNQLFDPLLPLTQEALLEHCVKHLLHLHISRRKERSSGCWDICSDLAINPAIEGMPKSSPLPSDYNVPEGLAAEEYYTLLLPVFDIGNLSGDGIGAAGEEQRGKVGGSDGEQHFMSSVPVDDHSCWQDSDGIPQRLVEEMVRSMVRDAIVKSDGEVPGDIRPLVESFLKPSSIPWRQILRQFVANAGRVGKKSTWQREHRRFQHDTPGAKKNHRLNLLVGIDVSDSTDIHELREMFARELKEIAKGSESWITVLYANSRIQRIENLSGKNIRSETYHGGGFTDLRPVFEYASSMKPLPAAVIYLTDGYGEAPAKMEFPTLWVLTADGKKPAKWGVELRLEV